MKTPSLTRAAAAAAAIAATAVTLVWAHDAGGPHAMGHGMGHSARHMAQIAEHIKAEAATTPQQGAQIDALVAQADADLQGLHAELRQDHQRALAALTQANVDRAQLEDARQGHLRAAEQGSRRITQLLADVAEVLTPEQRQRMAAHVARRHGR